MQFGTLLIAIGATCLVANAGGSRELSRLESIQASSCKEYLAMYMKWATPYNVNNFGSHSPSEAGKFLDIIVDSISEKISNMNRPNIIDSVAWDAE